MELKACNTLVKGWKTRRIIPILTAEFRRGYRYPQTHDLIEILQPNAHPPPWHHSAQWHDGRRHSSGYRIPAPRE